jgi:PhnB protein
MSNDDPASVSITKPDRWPRSEGLGILRDLAAPTPYIFFPGNAREALAFYASVFGGELQLHTFAEFGRSDGPADAIAHGYLAGAPVALYASDVAGDEPAFRAQGLMLSLLGTADPGTLGAWFSGLAKGGRIVDDLQARPWGASDGQVIDRYGVHWLIGFQHEAGD